MSVCVCSGHQPYQTICSGTQSAVCLQARGAVSRSWGKNDFVATSRGFTHAIIRNNLDGLENSASIYLQLRYLHILSQLCISVYITYTKDVCYIRPPCVLSVQVTHFTQFSSTPLKLFHLLCNINSNESLLLYYQPLKCWM